MWRSGGRKGIKNRVQTGSQGGPDGSVGAGLIDGADAKQVRVCGAIDARGISIAPPQSTQRTLRLKMPMRIAHSLYPHPPRCA